MIAFLLLAGCPDPLGISEVETGTFAIGVAAAQPDDYEVDDLWVTLNDLVLDADAPSGPESVAVLLDHTYTPLETRDTVGFDLEVGEHTHGRLQLSILADDGPGLDCTGSSNDDEDRFQIRVDTLDLSFDLPTITIGQDPLVGRVRFHPNEWLKEAEDSQNRRDEGDDVVIDSSSGEAYDRVLEAIRESTTFDFGPPATTSPTETESSD